MSPETAKQIRWNEHDRMWTPPAHHEGPWKIYQGRVAEPRLVWAYKREWVDGVECEESSYAGELK